jgi:hypothetical protein
MNTISRIKNNKIIKKYDYINIIDASIYREAMSDGEETLI